jgi:glutathione S-transferase
MAAAEMTKPVLFGASYSVYVRIGRLALLEKEITHDLHEVDVFAEGGLPADYLSLHPFARIPAFRHGDVVIYETSAITRYIDEAFPGPSLQPRDALARARMNQIIQILDNYLYRPLVWDIYVARDEAMKAGLPADEAAIAAANEKTRHCLGVLEDFCEDWLAGDALTLADLHAAPMIVYGLKTADGRALLAERPRLSAWWHRIAKRPSMMASKYPSE